MSSHKEYEYETKLEIIIAIIDDLVTSYNLKDLFTTDFNDEKLPESIKKDMPKENAFLRNVFLKEHLGPYLNVNDKFEMEFWLINSWGEISGFKDTPKNRKRINGMYQKLSTRVFTRDIFDCISSFSKLASFYVPAEYSIYDSRAVYSLNWLLFRAGVNKHFFPIPNGRNKSLVECDLETILRLFFKGENELFIDYKYAYFLYCDLIKALSGVIWADEDWLKRPYYLEMLLFSLCTKLIIEDIQKSVSVSFNLLPLH